MIMISNDNINIDNGEESASLESSVNPLTFTENTSNFFVTLVEEGASSRAVEYKPIKYNDQIMKTNTSKIELMEKGNNNQITTFNILHSTKTSAVQHVFEASTLASEEPTGLFEQSTMQQRFDEDNVMTSESAQPSSAQGKSAVDSSIVNQSDLTGREDGASIAGAGHHIA